MSNGTYQPDTFGDRVPVFGDAYYYPKQSLALTDTWATYGAVYRAQVWVSALVNKLAFATARLPFKVYERGSDGSRSEARDTPYAALLRNPNPRHSAFFLWLWTVSTFEIYGEAMWVKIRPRPGAAPIQLWPMHPANVTTRRDKASGDVIYRFVYGTSSEKFLEWGSADVVHFRSYNPDDQVRGMSRLEPLRQTLVSEDATRRASAAMWRNGGQPSMVLTHPKEMSEPATRRLRAGIESTYSGIENWGKIAILEEGMTPHVMQLNADQLQFIESRKMNREEACGVYDVPPPVVHILDQATFSNITEQMRSMYRDTMAPRLGLYESELELQLRPDFDPRGSVYAEFLMDGVMRGAFEQRAAANQSAIFSGQRTPNEVREDDNLPPLPGGEKLYINAGAIPLEADSRQDDPGVIRQTEDGTVPPPTKSVVTVDSCVSCDNAGNLSARGLCRSCEGKAGALLQLQKGR